MFSGIVESVGRIDAAEPVGRLALRSSFFSPERGKLKVGDSVAVSGVCLTIVELGSDTALFDLASETLRRTTLGGLRAGAEVNLERSLRFGSSVDGHFVQGHVDGVAEVLKCESENETTRVLLTVPEEVRELIVPKGAVTVDGVSLTVGEVSPESFSVYLIPHTKEHTTFKNVQPGRLVNIEADCIARYVASSTKAYLDASAGGSK